MEGLVSAVVSTVPKWNLYVEEGNYIVFKSPSITYLSTWNACHTDSWLLIFKTSILWLCILYLKAIPPTSISESAVPVVEFWFTHDYLKIGPAAGVVQAEVPLPVVDKTWPAVPCAFG